MRIAALALALAVVALTDCATLDPLAEGVCGNGVVDANEDCDGFAPAGLATGRCGAPSEGASACRLQCSSAGDCPDGWGCAVGGTCRDPSGRFNALGEGVSAGVETMVVGDFDGDRRKDILGSGPHSTTSTAKVRVHYFGEGAALSQVNALSAPISSPTVQDFDKDGVDDFAFGLDIGALGVMTGQLDRSLIPAVFPSGRIPKSDAKPVLLQKGTRRLPSGGDTDFLFAGRFTAASGQQVNALSSLEGKDPYTHVLPVGPEGIVGDPVWAPFLTADPDSTCGEIAIAMKAETPNGVIQVFSPCRPKILDSDGNDAAWASARSPITIESPLPLEGGIHVFDEKNDGQFDILFGAKGDSGRRVVFLARSNGTGFEKPIATALADLPIASGDLDLDGRVDFVLPTALALSKAPGALPADAGADAGTNDGLTPFRDYLQVDTGRRARWTTARIGQFNGDALPDVVAAASDQPDVDFLGATTAGAFVRSTISTTGSVSRIAVGDFDGDKLVDVGFVQKRSGSSDQFDVAIAYGRPNGPPEPARVVGRTGEVLNLDPLFDPGSPDAALQGLALFIREPAADGGLPDLAFALIIGNGDRQPVAPLLLNDFFANRKDPDPDIYHEWVPFEVHAGPVAQKDRVDLVALAVGYRVSRSRQQLADGPYPAAVWVAPGKGGTSFDAPSAVQELGLFAAGERGLVVLEARTVIGDIDTPRDGKSEVVAFQRAPGQDDLKLVVNRPPEGATPLDLPGERIRRDAPLALLDVDADGSPDVVVILGDEGERRVVVFYNDGKGGFVVPGASVALGDGEVPRGFAQLTTQGASADGTRKARRELAVVSDRRLVLATPDASDRSRFSVRDVPTGGGAPLASATGIVSGDFDGDGVDDLAIADGGALRILRQLPRQ